MNRLRTLVDDLMTRLPSNKTDRIKILAAVPVAVLCSLWIVYMLLSQVDLSGPARPPNTPAARVAIDLSNKLLEREEFVDTGIEIVSESPLKFRVVGAVRSEHALTELDAYLKQLRPEQDYEVDVVVLPVPG